MKNIPSFQEFSENHDFLEPIEESLLREFASLQKGDPYYSVNESSLLDQVKNQISKFFLGSFSHLNMIDEARGILLDLRIELIEKEDEFEKKIEDIQKQISSLSSEDRAKIEELQKKREALVREIEAFAKAQELKIKKAKDVTKKLAEKNKRRQDYLEAGLAEDEIAIAELEYELAKKRTKEASKLQRLKMSIEKAKDDASKAADELKKKTKEAGQKGATAPTDFVIDPEAEKKKIIGKKPQDILLYKKKLEHEISDQKYEIEKLIEDLAEKVKKGKGTSQTYLQNLQISLIEKTERLDCNINILKTVSGLGDKEDEIRKATDSKSELDSLAKLINQDIKDGQDSQTGTKKIVHDLFKNQNNQLVVDQAALTTARKKMGFKP